MTDQPTAVPPPSAPPRRMATLKKVLIGLGVLALLGAVAAFVALRATQGPVDASNRFLKLNATDGPAAAFAAASPAFQASGGVAAWEQYARAAGLTEFKSATWTSREVNASGTARLEGSIATSTGATLPATVELVKANGGWRVQTLKLTPAGFQQPPAPTASPAPQAAPASNPGVRGSGGETAGTAPPAGGVLPGYPSDPAPTVTAPPAAPLPGGAGRLGSVVPANGAPIPGAKVAGTCKQVLLETTGIDFDSISCLSPQPVQAGSVTQCSVSKGAKRGTMTVTTGAYDAASGRVGFNCSVGAPQ